MFSILPTYPWISINTRGHVSLLSIKIISRDNKTWRGKLISSLGFYLTVFLAFVLLCGEKNEVNCGDGSLYIYISSSIYCFRVRGYKEHCLTSTDRSATYSYFLSLVFTREKSRFLKIHLALFSLSIKLEIPLSRERVSFSIGLVLKRILHTGSLKRFSLN